MLASLSVCSVTSTTAPFVEPEQNAQLTKHQDVGSPGGVSGRPGNWGGGHGGSGRPGNWNGGYGGGGKRSSYYRYGRYWYWDGDCDDEFIVSLRYRPSVYYGQRFQYLYLYQNDFRARWNSDINFRRRWDTDISFRNECFKGINYSSWTSIVIDNIDDYYYGRGRFRGYGRRRYRNKHRKHRRYHKAVPY